MDKQIWNIYAGDYILLSIPVGVIEIGRSRPRNKTRGICL